MFPSLQNMSRRTILSRPRTKVYNANYDIGQSYYQPAIDRLDRKYSGRPLSPTRSAPSVAQDVLDRHQRAFTDEDLSTARRRAEQHITEDNVFDLRSHRRPMSTAFDCEDEFDDEVNIISSLTFNKNLNHNITFCLKKITAIFLVF